MKKGIILAAFLGIIFIGFGQEKAHAVVHVTDFEEAPISGAQVLFFNTEKGEIIKGVSDDKGLLIVDLEAGEYNIRLKSVGKSKDYTVIEIPKLAANEVYNDVQIFIQYEEDRSFTLSDLHFESGKSIIKTNSYAVLDELVTYLENKNSLKIEVGGHTDDNGSEASNLVLSQNRADAVKQYLVKKGIQADRIQTKGYGESEPIADNGNENGKALNRRTEINIIE